VTAAVELQGVSRDFSVGWTRARILALDSLSLRIEPGEVVGLLGPNGSGKSTTIKIVLGLLEPTVGDVRIWGLPSRQVAARRSVGYLPESPHFHRFLSGRELLRFYARVCGVPGRARERRIVEVLDWVGLGHAADRRVESYSKGMRQRIGLAQALVHSPQLVILDEPTAGVDPGGAAEMVDLIRRLKSEGKTVLVTSHLLSQIEEVCDRVFILDRGRLIASGSLSELLNKRDLMNLVSERLSAEDLSALRLWFDARGRSLVAVEPARDRLDRVFAECIQAHAEGSSTSGRRNGEVVQ